MVKHRQEHNNRTFVIHNNSKLLIGSIEEHKLQESENFCILIDNEGVERVCTMKQFQEWASKCNRKDRPNYEGVTCIQSFIKEKQ